ncbi:hypothetical protein CISG_07288 [Coccidioides immitis RMSCC 3703]|uniref:Uncharacterized protein n=1 Tax=Coccidioides immitis RMSCC 3703 TaxID=454286 RepID=A0A0J8TYT0_COCIT|nr:hypothetical protein CISG_07288 [Coccidioides immitis RMSCC 3703]
MASYKKGPGNIRSLFIRVSHAKEKSQAEPRVKFSLYSRVPRRAATDPAITIAEKLFGTTAAAAFPVSDGASVAVDKLKRILPPVVEKRGGGPQTVVGDVLWAAACGKAPNGGKVGPGGGGLIGIFGRGPGFPPAGP